jgi:hypothetical protein
MLVRNHSLSKSHSSTVCIQGDEKVRTAILPQSGCNFTSSAGESKLVSNHWSFHIILMFVFWVIEESV